MKKYTLYEIIYTGMEDVQVRKYRRGWKDVRVCLHNKKTKAEWDAKVFDNSKDANKYAKQLADSNK